MQLPVHAVKDDVLRHLTQVPVVLTAPTGTGKSTEVPRWGAQFGKVLVVEPRRVACTALAARVASLEQVTLGKQVGYHVRADKRLNDSTRITFVTPGIALRYIASGRLGDYQFVMLDEFHERGMETDLIAALVRVGYKNKLLITSATVNAERLCDYFGAHHIHAAGQQYDVKVRYVETDTMLPHMDSLSHLKRLVKQSQGVGGDILVFLPGKGEIQKAATMLTGLTQFDVVSLHGGLALEAQGRVFEPGRCPKVILATNVAETSVTIPNVKVVIDTGLVKRTRYVDNRGFLTLMPIAMDSADQRKGRAGRVSDGICYRLWSKKAILEPQTPPEIHRESLTPLYLLTTLCGVDPESLRFVDAPRDYALDNARAELRRIGGIDELGKITPRGEFLCRLPLPAHIASFVAEAEARNNLSPALDVVSILEQDRDLFKTARRPIDPREDLRKSGCDVMAILNAVHTNPLDQQQVNADVVHRARQTRRELYAAFGGRAPDVELPDNALVLNRAMVAADPLSAYVARRKKGRLFFSNGGKEITLSDKCAIDENKVEAIVVYKSMAMGLGYRNRDAKITASCASPVSLQFVADAGLGVDNVAAPFVKAGIVYARIERVYAGQRLATTEEVPKGHSAVLACKELFLAGRLFPKALGVTGQRLQQVALLKKINAVNRESFYMEPYGDDSDTSLDSWVETRLTELGITSGDDIQLLSQEDLMAPALPEETARYLFEKFPFELDLKNIVYRVEYDISRKQVTLVRTGGTAKEAPSVDLLPAFTGFKVKVKHNSRTWVLRG